MIIEAYGLGLRTRRGWVFRDVDLTADEGELHAVTGPAASGRTSLLLALAGRFPTTEGRLVRHGTAALGHVAGVHEPDPELTVAEHVTERLLLLGPPRDLPSRAARRAYRRDALAAALDGAGLTGGVPLDPAARGRDLAPVQRQVLGLVLATLSRPRLIVADDVDAGADPSERAWLWAALARLAAQGHAVVVSARAVEPGSARSSTGSARRPNARPARGPHRPNPTPGPRPAPRPSPMPRPAPRSGHGAARTPKPWR